MPSCSRPAGRASACRSWRPCPWYVPSKPLLALSAVHTPACDDQILGGADVNKTSPLPCRVRSSLGSAHDRHQLVWPGGLHERAQRVSSAGGGHGQRRYAPPRRLCSCVVRICGADPTNPYLAARAQRIPRCHLRRGPSAKPPPSSRASGRNPPCNICDSSCGTSSPTGKRPRGAVPRFFSRRSSSS